MQVTLLSVEFVGLAVVAVLLLTTLAGLPRQLVFLALNLSFLGAILLPPVGVVSTLLFTLAGYGVVHAARRHGRAGLVGGITLFVLAFVYMRRYDFLEWVLPDSLLTGVLATAGLSFVFFKILHVAVDAHSGTLGRIDLLSYVNYCLNFTTFAMGPIQRFQDYREQWTGQEPALLPTFEAHLDAVLRVLGGFVKAYVAALLVEPLMLRPDTDLLALNPTGLFVQSWAFWIFLYLNFSGYCDIVIGIGSLFGVRPPENFDRPYLARNISDFWLRQHRTLTLWLTDYVFSPLYKKALTTPRVARYRLAAANGVLMATMLVSGLWHGTTVSFFLFGVAHGLCFVIYRTWSEVLSRWLGKQRLRELRDRWYVRAGGVVLTFNATALAFVFFQVRPERVMEAVRALTGA